MTIYWSSWRAQLCEPQISKMTAIKWNPTSGSWLVLSLCPVVCCPDPDPTKIDGFSRIKREMRLSKSLVQRLIPHLPDGGQPLPKNLDSRKWRLHRSKEFRVFLKYQPKNRAHSGPDIASFCWQETRWSWSSCSMKETLVNDVSSLQAISAINQSSWAFVQGKLFTEISRSKVQSQGWNPQWNRGENVLCLFCLGK